MATAKIVQRMIDHTQLSPNGATRTNFTPGKATGRPLDQNWPKQFDVYSPIPVVQALITEGRLVQSVIIDNKKRSVNEPEIPEPIVLDTNTITSTNLVTEEESSYTQTITATQNNNGQQEKKTGYFGFKSNS